MRKSLLLLTLFCVVSCNLGGSRHPANSMPYLKTDEPVAFAQIKLSTIERGIKDIFARSAMVKSLDRFEMDPATRILNIAFTIDYPLESLFNFTKIPDNNIRDEHTIELALSLPETKTLGQTRYMGLSFHKFIIDGDDYLDAFEIVAAVVQTVLANSELVDYLYKEHADNIPDQDHRLLLQEVLNENGIVIFHSSRKINFKLDLSKISHLNPYLAEYDNLRLWRFSPTLFDGKEIRFKIIAGEGKPSDLWLSQQQARISEDTRTLLQVRNDLYQEYSNLENVDLNIKNYMNSLLEAESIDVSKLPANYQNEIQGIQTNILQAARNTLNRQNDNFIADPEYEYVQFTEYSRNQLRTFVAGLDHRASLDAEILRGGSRNSLKKPLVTKLISQDLLNRGMNFLTDIEAQGNQLFTEAEMWLLPQAPGVALRARLHLPLEYLLGLMDKELSGKDYESKITDSHAGYPVELLLETKMADNGKLGLDIKKFTVNSGSNKLEFDRNSKNKSFLIDLTKLYLANSLSAVKLNATDFRTEEAAKRAEIAHILEYISNLKSQYTTVREKKLNELLARDLLHNPFSSTGRDYLNRKKEIILGQVFKYNEQTKLFEIILNPDLLVDKVNNVRHDLQVWGVTPIYSKELNNTFLEMTVGQGLRPQKYIDELYFRGGSAENSQFSGVYYELGDEKSQVDMLMSLNFDYLQHYINNFLDLIVKNNSIDIAAQAQENKGERFFEIEHLDLNISSEKKIILDLKIKTAKYARTWRRAFVGRQLSEDTYSLSAELNLESKSVPTDNTNISTLGYFPEAISVIPTKVKIKSGSPSLVNRAITNLISGSANLALNNGTFKKLLLKMINKSLTKMYQSTDDTLVGHPIEKVARLQTTRNDILIYLNPKLAGPAFDIHLSSGTENINKSIKLDAINQMVHVALTSGAAMAKSDKKKLLKLIAEIENLSQPYRAAQNKNELEQLLVDQQLVGNFLTNTDSSKLSLYNKYIGIMNKYDQVLHTAKIPHANELEWTRISASGAELMYFASVAFKFKTDLKLLVDKMKRYQLTESKHYYSTFVEAYEKINSNIYIPLIEQYQQKNHQINKTVTAGKVSYWTYQLYGDAYLAEEVYRIIKN